MVSDIPQGSQLDLFQPGERTEHNQGVHHPQVLEYLSDELKSCLQDLALSFFGKGNEKSRSAESKKTLLKFECLAIKLRMVYAFEGRDFYLIFLSFFSFSAFSVLAVSFVSFRCQKVCLCSSFVSV